MTKTFEITPVGRQKSFYGKAIVTECNQFYTLTSYTTQVARICKDSGDFTRLWGGYSATTMKHINSFLAGFAHANGLGKKEWEALEVL